MYGLLSNEQPPMREAKLEKEDFDSTFLTKLDNVQKKFVTKGNVSGVVWCTKKKIYITTSIYFLPGSSAGGSNTSQGLLRQWRQRWSHSPRFRRNSRTVVQRFQRDRWGKERTDSAKSRSRIKQSNFPLMLFYRKSPREQSQTWTRVCWTVSTRSVPCWSGLRMRKRSRAVYAHHAYGFTFLINLFVSVNT